jgi:hypothetical protein
MLLTFHCRCKHVFGFMDHDQDLRTNFKKQALYRQQGISSPYQGGSCAKSFAPYSYKKSKKSVDNLPSFSQPSYLRRDSILRNDVLDSSSDDDCLGILLRAAGECYGRFGTAHVFASLTDLTWQLPLSLLISMSLKLVEEPFQWRNSLHGEKDYSRKADAYCDIVFNHSKLCGKQYIHDLF